MWTGRSLLEKMFHGTDFVKGIWSEKVKYDFQSIISSLRRSVKNKEVGPRKILLGKKITDETCALE